jgi:hypothetical protein
VSIISEYLTKMFPRSHVEDFLLAAATSAAVVVSSDKPYHVKSIALQIVPLLLGKQIQLSSMGK